MAHDVAIIGAGPAGARAAWRLARAGARVALIDGSHPREKPCGGGVTGRALRLVADQLAGRETELRDGLAVRRAVFAQHGARAVVDLRVSASLPESALVIFSRAAFDELLLHSAVAAGATHVSARVRDVTIADGSPQVRLETGHDVRARWVIGADGANSLLRRRVSAPVSRADLSVAAGFFVHGAVSEEIFVEFVTDPAGYLWSFPRTDHLAVGVCAQANQTTAERLREIARDWIVRERVAGDLERYSWPIPSLSASTLARQQTAGPCWLLAGDAAGLVDPITREGIFFALQSADLAADALLDGRNPAADYADALRAGVVAELIRAARLKAGFFRPRFMSLLLKALQTSAPVRLVMADLVAGEQPYRTLVPRLLSTLEVRLAWELARLRRGRLPH